MWRPTRIGDVIAERKFEFTSKAAAQCSVRVRFGRPVQGRKAVDEPWWCPVQVRGAGLDLFEAIPGVDSLQALILALETANELLLSQAARARGTVSWLGAPERLVLARQSLSKGSETALVVLLGYLRATCRILDSGSPSSAAAATRAIRALEAIGKQAGIPRRRRKV